MIGLRGIIRLYVVVESRSSRPADSSDSDGEENTQQDTPTPVSGPLPPRTRFDSSLFRRLSIPILKISHRCDYVCVIYAHIPARKQPKT